MTNTMTAQEIDAEHEACDGCGRIIPKGFGKVCAGCLNRIVDQGMPAGEALRVRDERAQEIGDAQRAEELYREEKGMGVHGGDAFEDTMRFLQSEIGNARTWKAMTAVWKNTPRWVPSRRGAKFLAGAR